MSELYFLCGDGDFNLEFSGDLYSLKVKKENLIGIKNRLVGYKCNIEGLKLEDSSHYYSVAGQEYDRESEQEEQDIKDLSKILSEKRNEIVNLLTKRISLLEDQIDKAYVAMIENREKEASQEDGIDETPTVDTK